MKFAVSFLVVLLAVASLCTMASAAVVNQTDLLYAGWNLISMQGVPLTPAPTDIFTALTPHDLNGAIYRWDGATQSQNMFDEWNPPLFGNFLLGDGYWVVVQNDTPYNYNALSDTDTMDVWISLPKAGWNLIGNPFSYNYDWNAVKVTDGNATIDMTTAAKTNIWLESVGFFWVNEHQSQATFGLPDDWPEYTYLMPKHGYWVISDIDKIALIMEAH